MQAEVKSIQTNDITTWPTWGPVHPSEEFQWFTVSIGPTGVTRADMFQVVVASARGLKERRTKSPFVGIVVSTFAPAEVEQAIQEVVAKVEAPTWEGIAEQLQPIMQWEFANYRP